MMTGVFADMAMKANVWEVQTLADTFIGQSFVPTRQTFLAILHIFTAQHFVQSVSQRHFARRQLSVFHYRHRKRAFGGDMIRVLLLLFEPSLQSGREEIRRVRADLSAKQIERIAEPEIDVFLNDVERNAVQRANIATGLFLY